jgi:hypothetical protein
MCTAKPSNVVRDRISRGGAGLLTANQTRMERGRYSSGSMQVRILSRRYSSLRKP